MCFKKKNKVQLDNDSFQIVFTHISKTLQWYTMKMNRYKSYNALSLSLALKKQANCPVMNAH